MTHQLHYRNWYSLSLDNNFSDVPINYDSETVMSKIAAGEPIPMEATNMNDFRIDKGQTYQQKS